MRTVYYLTAASRLQAGDTYQQSGVLPIVILPNHGSNLFTPSYAWGAAVGPIAAQVDGPFWAGLWAQHTAQKLTLAPWDDESGWKTILGNLTRLSALLPPGAGVVFDSEIYWATPGSNGGLMDRRAWPAGDKAELRGRQVREAIGDRPFGQYVLVSDAKGHEGWRQFWRGAYRPGDLLLDESGFLRDLGASKATAFTGRRGVRNLPGRTIKDGKLQGRIPPRDFWVYPWAGEDRPGVLEGVSGKWK